MFAQYELPDIDNPTKGKLRTRTIVLDRLRGVKGATRWMRTPKLPTDVGGRIDGIGTLSSADQQAVAWAMYDQLIGDEWARPVYSDDGWQAMRGHRWAVQNFALVNQQRYQSVLTASARGMGAQIKVSGACTSCSTSSNACSSTSSSIIIKSET